MMDDVNVLCQGQPVTTDGAYPGSEGSMPPLQTKQTPKTLLGKESRMATIAEDTTMELKKNPQEIFEHCSWKASGGETQQR